MPSPFPGMDPFIESQLWEGFHANFINEMSVKLVAQLRPHYDVGVEKRVYLERRSPEETARTYVADVGITSQTSNWNESKQTNGTLAIANDSLVESKRCTLPWPEEHREAYLVIRRHRSSEVVTVIELLSPTNKLRQSDGREIYLQKRMELLQTRSHFIELDLLRGGEHMPFSDPPNGDYFALISRTGERPDAEVLGWPLSHRLPVIPIPLATDDPDVPLDIQAVFDMTYDRHGYDYMLDYTGKASPALSTADQAWSDELLSNRA